MTGPGSTLMIDPGTKGAGRMAPVIGMQTVAVEGADGSVSVHRVYTIDGEEATPDAVSALQKQMREDELERIAAADKLMEAARIAASTPPADAGTATETTTTDGGAA